MEKEELRTNVTQLDEAKLGVAPKALDPDDVVLGAGKLVCVVMNAPVFVTTQEQAVIAEPAVGMVWESTCPLMIGSSAALEQFLTTPMKTLPLRLSSPMTASCRRLRVRTSPARAVGQNRTRQFRLHR